MKSQKENEFQEKADEEEELEKEENNNKNQPELSKHKINQDPFDISDEEDEVQDKISDLNSVPNFFKYPNPQVALNHLYHPQEIVILYLKNMNHLIGIKRFLLTLT